MKINFKNIKPEDIYEVGNLIRNEEYLYLVVRDIDGGYLIVNLSHDQVIGRYKTIEELIKFNESQDNVLVNAEINVF
ncbi:hypothetical protein [Ligilactobacillus salivarius]|uniref:hypothetical protein n=1 Tax=Ligilactobacillus salivarius TaxID=1624 RepID=UPI002B45A121|nr:hypothetical protein [Ligilactobacillus salivarius]